MTIHILLVDDHTVLRAGLKLLLESQPDLRVISEAANGLDAIDMAKTLQPNLILLDISMPGFGGLDAIQALRNAAPNAKTLILTMHDDVQYLRAALKNGAAGYVLKKAADSELISAIRAVLRGEIYVHPALTRFLLDDMLPKPETGSPDLWNTLSEREQSVLRLVALGHTSTEIAESLNLSAKTVETYRARGMEKLNLPNRAALVRFALKKGLISAA